MREERSVAADTEPFVRAFEDAPPVDELSKLLSVHAQPLDGYRVVNFLGISPDMPAKSLSVVPDVPESWPSLSVQNLRVGSGTVAASASRSGKQYTAEVSAPAGCKLTIGHTLPAGATVKTVTLDGKTAKYDVVDTTRGREVRVETTTDQCHTLIVTTG